MSLGQKIQHYYNSIDCSNSLAKLLSIFIVNNADDNDHETKIFLQYWNIEILKEKLLSISNEEFEKIWIELLCQTNISSLLNPIVYHEILFKLLNTVFDNDDDEEFDGKEIIHKILITKLNNQSYLWKSFHHSIELVDENQCLCYSVKCLMKIIETIFIHPKQNDDYQIFDQQLESILELYYHNVDRRCFAYELLKFSSFIVTNNYNQHIPRVIDRLKNHWIHSNLILISYRKFFSQAHDFAGNILILPPSSSSLDLEFHYDCPLIRCYILLVLKILSIQDSDKQECYKFLFNHLNLLKSRIENIDLQNENFPIKWLIEIFITEDSELFEMFNHILLLYSTTKINDHNESEFLIHKLFEHFITKSIYNDSSVILDMLLTDQETASIVLQFLIAYLRILSFHRKQFPLLQLFSSIVQMFKELEQKIQKLNQKNLFPYNPKPLLRLLNNI